MTTPIGAANAADVFAPGQTNARTGALVPALEAFGPGGGSTYVNEADFQQPDFQRDFFGSHYPRMLGINRKYNPKGFFYAVKAISSKAWDVVANRRMCMAALGAVGGNGGGSA